ncbi:MULTISPECIES: YebY family protein [unclassified Providencia]|uniref:YebY family protein n=1 Tax=unclassified Providencia TaxID=2633465 RepID=UPI000E997A47|nr:YebY family protein [Providencia sp.]MBP6080479.1 YebY family protein [Providencia sp.]HBO22920.1 hypothetical protein [Providencia sp.]
MKYKLIICSLLLSGIMMGSAIAAPLTTVSKKQFGDEWPFTREEVMLECRSNGAMVVINPATLMQYPLNDIATSLMEKKEIKAQPIDILLAPKDTDKTTAERIKPLQIEAQKLCDNK